VIVKTQLGEDFRRFTVPRQVKLLSFVALLQKLYGYDTVKNDLLVQYKDEEGDSINITSDEELFEALRVAEGHGGGVLRLILSLVPAGSRTRTILFKGVPMVPSSEKTPTHVDEKYDAPKKETVEIKIELEPTTKSVRAVVIESTKSVSLPVAPRPNSVAALSASTALDVKKFSDSILLSVDAQHTRARDASAAASDAVLEATNASSDAVLLSVGEQSDKSRKISVPAEFVNVVTDLVAQTVALTNSYSNMTQQLVDPLSKQTIDAANEATRHMAAKLSEDVAAIVKMLMDTSV